MGGGELVDAERVSLGKQEEDAAADTVLTSPASDYSKRLVQRWRTNDCSELDSMCETAVEPSSKPQSDGCNSFTLAPICFSGTVNTGQDHMRAIENAFCSKKVNKLEVKSADGLGTEDSSYLSDRKRETPRMLRNREPSFEIGAYPDIKSKQTNHNPQRTVDESTAFTEIEYMREKIRRYKPGDGLLDVGGVGKGGFAVPNTTTLLLVGPSGAGKSTLINNMVRVLEKKTTGFDRAQTFEQKGDGSLFLQEYVFFEGAKHFSVFDSRGFSEKSTVEDIILVNQWMTNGIRHGEPVCRSSDNEASKEELKGRGRQEHADLSTKRRVDYAIFVLDAVRVHEMQESCDTVALDNLVTLFKSPFLSFKDDRPAVVMTHGDMLSAKDRILTRIYVGKIFGLSPFDHIFDISCLTKRTVLPGDEDPVSDLTLLNMLDFAMQRADRNLPYKSSVNVWLNKAYAGIMHPWNKLDHGSKTMLIGILVSWLFCLVLFLAARGVVHHGRHRWSIRDVLAKSILGKSGKKFLSKKMRRHP